MPSDTYKTFRVTVRPPRVACLIDSGDPDWISTVGIAIKCFSCVWGGSGFIIIPTNGNEIGNLFWEILLAYDPDYIWLCDRTNGSAAVRFRLSQDLVKAIKLRLAPFHHDDSRLSETDLEYGWIQNLLIEGRTHPGFKVGHPYTDLKNILPHCEHPRRILGVLAPAGIEGIWITSVTGDILDTVRNDFTSIGIDSGVRDFVNKPDEYFKTGVLGPRQLQVSEKVAFPFSFSSVQLGFYTPLAFAAWAETTLVVVGDSLDDFCLYFSLSRMRAKTCWLLHKWLPADLEDPVSRLEPASEMWHFGNYLAQLESLGQQQGHTMFLTTSAEPVVLRTIGDLLKRSHFDLHVIDYPMTTAPSALHAEARSHMENEVARFLQHPSRLFEVENFERIRSLHFIGSEIAGHFETPTPKGFATIVPSHRWVTDLSVSGTHLPRHPSLGTEVIREPVTFTQHARVGRDTIAYTDPRTGYINEDIDSWLRKPVVRLPTAFDIFKLLFNKLGYSTSISDKGRFALKTTNKFGSLSNLAYYFRDSKERAVLLSYLRSKPSETLENSGLYLSSDRRWYHDFATIQTLTGTIEAASKLIYHLLGISVFHRGLVLKCELCLGTDWYGIVEISSEFTCKRSGLKQLFGQYHALNRSEPPWFYKLDEVVFRALEHNFLVPSFANHKLSAASKTFDYCPELELTNVHDGSKYLELDICSIPDGKLTIGEAKMADRLANSRSGENRILTKYAKLADELGATQVVFATSSDRWQPATVERITNQFARSTAKVILWTKDDFYFK